MSFLKMLFLSITLLYASQSFGQLPKTVSKIKPAIVAIGIFNPMGTPRLKLVGTGFVIQPGNRVVTNYHVISSALSETERESYVVISGSGNKIQQHDIVKRALSPAHDLAVLTIGQTLPALTLVAQDTLVAEGSDIAFTGFPITQVLGLYPATHRGIIAAHTPVAIPVDHSSNLQSVAIRRLGAPYTVYQLDAVAYPGNSGSPLYLPSTGEVIGVINMVHVKTTREAVLSDPSGISYAIPIEHVKSLLTEKP
ncbi:MAG: serine protease [Paraglaciecola sp.]|nr:serine protease [Paraglaciecola sp.]